MRRPGGFTLLETVVALAILGLALMAIFDLNAGAVANHGYTKRLTVASLLARSKMTDLEQRLYTEGFSADDDEESGDFSDEGWSSFQWRARIIAPRTQGVSPEQLVGAIFNLPVGEGGLGALGGLFTQAGGPAAAAGGAPAAASAALPALAGPMMGLMQNQFTQMVDALTKAVREVHLTVSWRDGTQVESLDLVTHVVALGPGADRNTSPAPTTPGGLTGGGDAANEYVPANSGPGCVPVIDRANIVDGPNGTKTDRGSGTPLITRLQCLTAAGAGGGRTRPGGALPGLPGGSVR